MTSKNPPITRDDNPVSICGVVDRAQEFFVAQLFVIPLRCRIPSRLPLLVLLSEITGILVGCRPTASVVNEDFIVPNPHMVGVEVGNGEVVNTLVARAPAS